MSPIIDLIVGAKSLGWSNLKSSGGNRAVIMGGYTSAPVNTMDYIDISTTGNATSFGTLATARASTGGGSSNTRGIVSSGYSSSFPSSVISSIEYITLASAGNGTSFGNSLESRSHIGSVGGDTRCIMSGGHNTGNTVGTTDYITYATTGNATDWGNGFNAFNRGGGGNSTRGIIWGGWSSGGFARSQMHYVTIASAGTFDSWGNLSGGINESSSNGNSSSDTRLVYYPGHRTGTAIHYLTIATIGDQNSFGSIEAQSYGPGASSNKIRAIFVGTAPNSQIVYFTIATTGNYTNFGNLTQARGNNIVASQGHGGIS